MAEVGAMGNVSNRDLPDTYWTEQNMPLENYEFLPQQYLQSVQNGWKWQKRNLILFAAIAGGCLLIKIIRDQKITIEYLRFDENLIATELEQCKQLRLVYS